MATVLDSDRSKAPSCPLRRPMLHRLGPAKPPETEAQSEFGKPTGVRARKAAPL
jgi:hypothetical protein